MNADGTEQAPPHQLARRAIYIARLDSPNGKKIVFMSQTATAITRSTPWAPTAPTPDQPLQEPGATTWLPPVSPGGATIAFATARDNNYGDLPRWSADGANPFNLTSNPAGDYAPAYSPDGNKIAFASTRSGNDEIHEDEPRRLLPQEAHQARRASTRPRRPTFPGTQRQDRVRELQERQLRDLLHEPERHDPGQPHPKPAERFRPATVSPDGKKTAFVAPATAMSEVYRVNATNAI